MARTCTVSSSVGTQLVGRSRLNAGGGKASAAKSSAVLSSGRSSLKANQPRIVPVPVGRPSRNPESRGSMRVANRPWMNAKLLIEVSDTIGQSSHGVMSGRESTMCVGPPGSVLRSPMVAMTRRASRPGMFTVSA